MAILTSPRLLGTLSMLHLTIAYALVAAPARVLQHGLLFTLGAAMRLPQLSAVELLAPELGHPASFGNPLALPGNPALGLAAVFLAFLALSDLTALSMREEVYSAYWTAQAPVRLAGLFVLEGYIYLYKPAPGELAVGWTKGLKTDLVFAWAFVEMFVTFWVWLALRDERQETAKRAAQAAAEAQEKLRTE